MSQALGVRLWRSFQLRDTNLRITCVREETRRKHRHSKTGQRSRPHRDARVSFPSWLQVPSALHLPSDGIWGLGIASMNRKDPAYIRVSFYLNMEFFLDWPPIQPGSLHQITSFFQNPNWEELHKFFQLQDSQISLGDLHSFSLTLYPYFISFMGIEFPGVPLPFSSGCTPRSGQVSVLLSLVPLVWQEMAPHNGVSFIFPIRWLSLSTLL